MKRRQHYCIETLLLPTHEARVKEIRDRMDRLKASPEFKVASETQRAAALRDDVEALAKERARILADVSGYVPAAIKRWQEGNPQAVQRRAAVENPTRTVALYELVKRAGPGEALQIAKLLTDPADGFGARLAAGQFKFEDPALGAQVSETALAAGTSASPGLLRDVLLTKAAWAHTVFLADPDHPERALEAANDAYQVELGDGTTRGFSDSELAELLREDAG